VSSPSQGFPLPAWATLALCDPRREDRHDANIPRPAAVPRARTEVEERPPETTSDSRFALSFYFELAVATAGFSYFREANGLQDCDGISYRLSWRREWCFLICFVRRSVNRQSISVRRLTGAQICNRRILHRCRVRIRLRLGLRRPMKRRQVRSKPKQSLMQFEGRTREIPLCKLIPQSRPMRRRQIRQFLAQRRQQKKPRTVRRIGRLQVRGKIEARRRRVSGLRLLQAIPPRRLTWRDFI